MYLNPSNKWDNSITLEDKISFILVANILNEDDIVRHITEMSYDDFLRTPYWKAISDYVKYKFNCVCRLCKNTNNLNVHHKIYDNHGYEHRIAVIETDLTVLCRDCHKKIHGIK
jgi:5-methylcytosine-specific restriction endonuclease McrA